MADIFDFKKEKLERGIHLHGEAVCLHCKKQFEAVAEPGETDLRCPACGLERGVWSKNWHPEVLFQCGCGCCHFCVSASENLICTFCGKVQSLSVSF